jgi:hypothetical protein
MFCIMSLDKILSIQINMSNIDGCGVVICDKSKRVKVITFLTMLLTYTEEDQINIGFLAEASTGSKHLSCSYLSKLRNVRIACSYLDNTSNFIGIGLPVLAGYSV